MMIVQVFFQNIGKSKKKETSLHRTYNFSSKTRKRSFFEKIGLRKKSQSSTNNEELEERPQLSDEEEEEEEDEASTYSLSSSEESNPLPQISISSPTLKSDNSTQFKYVKVKYNKTYILRWMLIIHLP